MEFKGTFNLPFINLRMRANLVECEPVRIARWEGDDLYRQIQEKNTSGVRFVLHDSLPSTNGNVPMAIALNKIVKDIILRYEPIRGSRTSCIPGWDCHGLSIRRRVSKTLKEKRNYGPGRDGRSATIFHAIAWKSSAGSPAPGNLSRLRIRIQDNGTHR
jgi:isoleucyl-tRNA synthetase